MGLWDVPSGSLKPPKIGREDFFQILTSTKPSVSQNDLVKQQDFTNEFGLEG